jgi:hypothetical protein
MPDSLVDAGMTCKASGPVPNYNRALAPTPEWS